MMTKTEAQNYATRMQALHGKPWAVFQTPAAAPSNQRPESIFNTGRFMACDATERADYEAGGAVFV